MYTFIDGVEMNKKHPDTFEIPTQEELNSIKVGDSIKIGIRYPSGGGERFWTEIVEILDTGFKVRVDNDLLTDEPVGYNDVIEIEKRHVLSIYGK